MTEYCDCGGKVYSYPYGCPRCGAPTCCDTCCKEIASIQVDRETIERALKHADHVIHKYQKKGDAE
jgi:hypothetical protein